MDRLTHLVRRSLVFAGLAFAFVAILVLRGPTTTAVVSDTDLPATFRDFDPAQARTIEISRAKKDGAAAPETPADLGTAPGAGGARDLLRLVRRGDTAKTWVVESSFDYPARPTDVQDFLDKVRDARTRAEKTRNAERFHVFADPAGWTDVRVLDGSGGVLAAFGIGKGGADGNWQDTYLRLDERDAKGVPVPFRVVVATGGPETHRGTSMLGWVESRLWQGLGESELAAVAVEQREKKRRVEVVRVPKTGDQTEDAWKVGAVEGEAGVAADAKVATASAESLLRAFTGIGLQDLVAAESGPAADATYGFDAPTLVVVARKKTDRPDARPEEHRLTVGKKVEGKEHWYVRQDAQPWVFAVADYDLKAFRDDPSGWLERKPDAPPGEPAMAGEGGTPEAGMSDPGMSEPGMAEPPSDGAPGMGGEAPMEDPPGMTDEGPGGGSGMGETPPAPPPPPPAMDPEK